MLAKNLEHWARREHEAGRLEGHQEGRLETARNLLKLGVLSDAQIAPVTGLSGEQVRALREADQH